MRQFIVIILVLALVFPLDVVADEDKHDFILIMYEVMAAAGNADLVALSELMADDFKYSFGGSPSKEEALEYYRRDLELLSRMVDIIWRGCKPTVFSGDKYYVCPSVYADPDAVYLDYRAGFKKDADGKWIFQFFVGGD